MLLTSSFITILLRALLKNSIMKLLELHTKIIYLYFLTRWRIPHPGRVGGRFFIKYGMPAMLSWVLGGNRCIPKL